MNKYNIKQLSEKYNLPASTLRYYEEIGLLENVGRTESKQRSYNDEHIGRLDAIQCFRETGLSIAEMLTFFKLLSSIPENIDDIIKLLINHEQDVNEQINKYQENLLHLQHKIRFYKGIKEAIDEKKPWPCWSQYEEK